MIDEFYIALEQNPYLSLTRHYLDYFSNKKPIFDKITFLMEEYYINEFIYTP
jgi:hypothetical protein